MGTPMSTDSSAADAVADLTERRPEVVRRLLARGVPPRALEAVLPGWEVLLDQAEAPGPGGSQESAAS